MEMTFVDYVPVQEALLKRIERLPEDGKCPRPEKMLEFLAELTDEQLDLVTSLGVLPDLGWKVPEKLVVPNETKH